MSRVVGRGAWAIPRRLAMLLLFAVMVEFLVLPQLAGARRAVGLLADVNPAWLVAGVLLEAAAVLSYAQLTRALLPLDGRPRLVDLVRTTVATLGLSHVVPGGTAVSTSFHFRLLSQLRIPPTDIGFALATQGLGSAVVLNVLLWLGLVLSIPLRGFDPVYATAALLGAALIGTVAAAVVLLTRGEERVAAFVCRFGDRVPFLSGERVARGLRRVAERLRELAAQPRLLAGACAWAAANWLLDAASLWVFLAAFGHRASPDALIVAFGLANVLAAIPVTPGGLGVIEATLVATLVGFGADRGPVLLGVVSYRLVNFWLPIPLGAAAYARFRLSRWSHRSSEA